MQEYLTSGDVFEMYGDPVGAAGAEPVRQRCTILREAAARERHRAVSRQRVGIQEYAGRTLQRVLHVQHATSQHSAPYYIILYKAYSTTSFRPKS